MKMEQYTEKYNIVESGSVFTFLKESIFLEFYLDKEPDSKFKLEIKFEEEEGKGNKISSEVIGDGPSSYLKISIYNANIPGGLPEPFEIGQNSKLKKAYISMSFQKFGDSHSITYTIFSEK